ncbi:MAG: lysine transporter LysE [Robiginitomaculum sp.]|nr:MAG: lysine transporter LysE [Robiginitomaculum sp.]
MAFEVWLALVALFLVGGLTPGPAVMLVLASSFKYGFRPAMTAACGIASANVFWLILAATGAATLAATLPQAFTVLKAVGLLVILWLGFSTIFGPVNNMTNVEAEAPPRRKLFIKGLSLQGSNPMAAVTFAGILPTFFNTSQPLVPQFFIMITTLTVLELNGLAIYAGFGRMIRAKLSSPRAARIFNIIIGTVMIGAGGAAIFFAKGH